MLQIIIFIVILISFVMAYRSMCKNDSLIRNAYGIEIWKSLINFPKWSFVIFNIGILAIIFVSIFSNRMIDHWWFLSLGDEFIQVFYKKHLVNIFGFFVILGMSVTIKPISGLLFKILSGYTIRKESEFVDTFKLFHKYTSICVIFGLLIIGNILFKWDEVLFYIYGGTFDILESVHKKDIGFYVFTLPFLGSVMTYFAFYLFLLSVLLFGLEVKVSHSDDDYVDTNERSYIISFFIIGIFVPIIAWIKYMSYKLLITSSNEHVLAGPGYLTSEWLIPSLPYITLAFIFALLYILFSALKNGYKKSQIYVGGGVIVSTSLFFIFLNIYSSIKIDPDALFYEKPYIERNMEMTKWAYGLNIISEEVVIEGITEKQIRNNPDIVENTRVHDFETSLVPMDLFQRIKPFYYMIDVDVDRYYIDGESRLVMLSLRELNISGLTHKSTINTWFKYTHGFSFAAFMANEYSSQGYPEYIAKDMPNKTVIKSLTTNQPRIYFGELDESNQDFIFLNTRIKEYDFPSSEVDTEYTYVGVPKGAIKMNFFSSLIIANQNEFFKIFFNKNLTQNSYFVNNRNILTRVKKTLPFLNFDYDPLPVITDNGIIFIMDAYIENKNIPYSKGYIRNSVKVTINAYTGEVIAYIADESDPIIMVWDKIFPDLMKDISTMPKNLKSHLRYPEDLLKKQSEVYKTYHVDSAVRFSEGNNNYSITDDGGPVYNLTKLKYSGFEHMSMKLISTMNYEKLPNLAAILVGTWNNGPQLLSLHLNPDTSYQGAKQFEKSVKADEYIKEKLTLWGDNGAVIFGPIISNIISTDDKNVISMYYSQPIYVNSEGEGAIPQITRIAVGNNEIVAWADTAPRALANLFSKIFADKNIDTTEQQSIINKHSVDTNFIISYNMFLKKGDSKGLLQLLNAEEKRILNLLK